MLIDGMTNRRVKVVVVSAVALQRLIEAGERRYTFAGLPKDATVAGTWHDKERQSFGLVFEHPSFDEVRDGDVIPELEVSLSVRTDCAPAGVGGV